MSKFITLSGMENTGKSSLIKMFDDSYVKHFEPNSKYRDIVVNDEIDPITEMLIFLASKTNAMENVIKPAIKNGDNVISDRWMAELYVYQCMVNGAPIPIAKDVEKYMIKPTHEIILICGAETSLKRSSKKEINKFEKYGIEFHEKIRKEFINYYYIMTKTYKRDNIILIDTDVTSIENSWYIINDFIGTYK